MIPVGAANRPGARHRRRMQRHSVIVEGPLAFRMRRLRAAREADHGVQILTLPLLAARLAGGFCRAATRQELDPAIRAALAAGGLADLERIRELPGMARAVRRTLASLWDADTDPATLADRSPRLADIALLDVRVRTALPPGVLAPRDLRSAALARVSFAPAVIGAAELDRLGFVAPVWRPLLVALAVILPTRWHNPAVSDRAWFPGETTRDPEPAAAVPETVCCADPRSETVEALRWARDLLYPAVRGPRTSRSRPPPQPCGTTIFLHYRKARSCRCTSRTASRRSRSVPGRRAPRSPTRWSAALARIASGGCSPMQLAQPRRFVTCRATGRRGCRRKQVYSNSATGASPSIARSPSARTASIRVRRYCPLSNS